MAEIGFCRFRVPIERGRVVAVEVHPTLAAMRAAIAADVGHVPSRYKDTLGACIYDTKMTLKPGEPAARVYFCEKHLGPGMMAHEFTHAALVHARRSWDSPDNDEGREVVAGFVGVLVDAFWKRWSKVAAEAL